MLSPTAMVELPRHLALEALASLLERHRSRMSLGDVQLLAEQMAKVARDNNAEQQEEAQPKIVTVLPAETDD